MAKLLFRLRGVPEDETREILELLEQNNLDVYQTDAGNWGFSMPGLWLNDEHRYDQARQLIDDYQQERQIRVRKEREEQKRSGQQPTFSQGLLKRPLTTIALIAFCAVVLYFSVKPFFGMLE